MTDLCTNIAPIPGAGRYELARGLELARFAAHHGTGMLALTPPVRPGESAEALDRLGRALARGVAEEELSLELVWGGVVPLVPFLQSCPEWAAQFALPSGGGVLVTLPREATFEQGEACLRALRAAGLTPVLLCPESWEVLQSRGERLWRWLEWGMPAAVSRVSLLGRRGRPAMELGWKLIEGRKASCIVSEGRDFTLSPPRLDDVREEIVRGWGEGYARRLLCEGPRRLLYTPRQGQDGLPRIG